MKINEQLKKINKCEYCDNTFSSKHNLLTHQKNAKYCLKIQGISTIEPEKKYNCNSCNKTFNVKNTLSRHLKTCKQYIQENIYKEKNIILENENSKLKSKVEMLQEKLEEIKEIKDDIIRDKSATIKHLQDKLGGIAERAASRPTSSIQNTKNIQINNIIQGLDVLKINEMDKYVDQLTLDHHRQGARGYARFALEGPLKNKLCCTDLVREMYKFRGEDNNIHNDIKLQKVFSAFCEAFKMKSYELAQEHYQELAKKFTEAEMDNCETMNYAIWLARFKFDNDNKFCREIISYIKNNCNTGMPSGRKIIKLSK